MILEILSHANFVTEVLSYLYHANRNLRRLVQKNPTLVKFMLKCPKMLTIILPDEDTQLLSRRVNQRLLHLVLLES